MTYVCIYVCLMTYACVYEFEFLVFNTTQQYFSYIMATSFSVGGSRSTRGEPLTLGKQLVNFITCGC